MIYSSRTFHFYQTTIDDIFTLHSDRLVLKEKSIKMKMVSAVRERSTILTGDQATKTFTLILSPFSFTKVPETKEFHFSPLFTVLDISIVIDHVSPSITLIVEKFSLIKRRSSEIARPKAIPSIVFPLSNVDALPFALFIDTR